MIFNVNKAIMLTINYCQLTAAMNYQVIAISNQLLQLLEFL
jgi:hypothetical protein